MFGKKQEKPIIIESTIVETREERLHREQAEFVARVEQDTAKWNMKQGDIARENWQKTLEQAEAASQKFRRRP